MCVVGHLGPTTARSDGALPSRAAACSGRSPAAPDDSGMAQVMTWLFSDGSSSVADADADSQELSVASMQARTLCNDLSGSCRTQKGLSLDVIR